MTVTRWCSECAADAAFERLDRAEHSEDCIELVCVLCGAGFELAPVQGVSVVRGGEVTAA
jgi:hypothetical protein